MENNVEEVKVEEHEQIKKLDLFKIVYKLVRWLVLDKYCDVFAASMIPITEADRKDRRVKKYVKFEANRKRDREIVEREFPDGSREISRSFISCTNIVRCLRKDSDATCVFYTNLLAVAEGYTFRAIRKALYENDNFVELINVDRIGYAILKALETFITDMEPLARNAALYSNQPLDKDGKVKPDPKFDIKCQSTESGFFVFYSVYNSLTSDSTNCGYECSCHLGKYIDGELLWFIEKYIDAGLEDHLEDMLFPYEENTSYGIESAMDELRRLNNKILKMESKNILKVHEAHMDRALKKKKKEKFEQAKRARENKNGLSDSSNVE